jgi:hypothetical protein
MNAKIERPIANPPLNAIESAAATKLSAQELGEIDAAILACVVSEWRKVAMIVAMASQKLEAKFPQFSYVFYTQRIVNLVADHRLESQGNVTSMRFSEVRHFPHRCL